MKKRLTLNFKRSIASEYNRGDRLEVVVTPLDTASSPDGNVTLVEQKQVQRVTLRNEVTPLYFDITPTYEPGLTEPIFYRIAWRVGNLGRITETDFAMPDRDVDFDDLGELGNIIDGQSYLREADLGVAGRVARLNNDGNVLDAQGNEIGAISLGPITAALSQEVRDRQSAVADMDRRLTVRLETQVTSLSATINTRVSTEAQNRANALAVEKLERELGDQAVNDRVTSLQQQNNTSITGLTNRVNAHDTALAGKADLVNGKLATSQIPAISLITRVTVPDEAAMLALTRSQVQPGDLAVRPDGNWQLFGDDPSDIENWMPTSSGGNVASVNGQTGIVVLSAADVGARARNEAIPQADVNGLVSALSARATTAQLSTTNSNVTALTGRMTTAEATLTTLDGQVIKKVDGLLPTALLGDDVPRVNSENHLVRKDGTLITTGGGGTGGGAVDSVNNKVGAVILNASDVGARPVGVPIPQSEVDGLVPALNAKTDSTTTQALATRVSRAEVDIADLQANGGGGGTGTSSKTSVSWVADVETDPRLVTVKSPFGLFGGSGAPYYDPNGAMEGEAAVPYVDENGYLHIRRLNPNATPAPVPASQGALSDLTTRVTLVEQRAKPETGWSYDDMDATLQASLDVVDNATASSSGDSLVLRNTAGTFAVSEPTGASHPATKGYVDTGLSGKASTASVTSLTSTVNGKASQSDLSALTTRVSNAESAFAGKADLDGTGKLAIGQLPALSGANISGWSTKADLDGAGKVPLSQVPTGIPQASVNGLTSALAAKADLVNGKLSTSQIPALAIGDTVSVANRAALLALTPTQVQRGDIGIIEDTSDKGTYRLIADDPSQWVNWKALSLGGGSVTSVNGQTGIITLGAADVGARSASTPVPQADVANLVSDLSAKAATSYVDAQVATRTTPAAVTTQINSQSVSKPAVDYVATSPVSLSGAQSVDGVLVGAGKRVLLTAQAASAQNGIYVSATGAWLRATDGAAGSTFMPNTVVAVRGGASNSNSIWQLTTTTSGVVDTNAQNWSKVLQGGPPLVYTAGNGIDITNQVASVKLAANPGLIADSNGLRLDTSAVIRKFAGTVPGGGTTVTIDHNLGTTDITFAMWEVATNTLVAIAPSILNANQISLEFAVAPSANQFRVVMTG
ncbi:virion structural protein [Gordonia phage Stormageddon]|uniref:Minor tail protein n=1 Tax=Gordonia phage Stormageddon TaxID=2656541 RepID=A0A649VT26_9CAUD|nr:virion structural protein [Gordonia phage Stormageddon]QGJ95072.1 hypothetical protein SEA_STORMAGEDDON_212 [Gordonia phage Stormageddon]